MKTASYIINCLAFGFLAGAGIVLISEGYFRLGILDIVVGVLALILQGKAKGSKLPFDSRDK